MGFTEELDAVEEKVEERVPAEPGDHERMSHYVVKDHLMVSSVEGVPLTALCGKTWVPNRDGTKFPVCPECKEIFESLPAD